MELFPQTYISWLSDVWWKRNETRNSVLELCHASPTPHLINGVSMTEERSSRQILKERLGLQLEWAAAILPYAANSDFSYFATKWELCPIPYCRVLWQGDKALLKEWCDTHPPPLLFSQMLCRVLEHTSLVICVSKGLWEEKIQRKQKEKHRKSFQFDASTFCQEFILHLWL